MALAGWPARPGTAEPATARPCVPWQALQFAARLAACRPGASRTSCAWAAPASTNSIDHKACFIAVSSQVSERSRAAKAEHAGDHPGRELVQRIVVGLDRFVE